MSGNGPFVKCAEQIVFSSVNLFKKKDGAGRDMGRIHLFIRFFLCYDETDRRRFPFL